MNLYLYSEPKHRIEMSWHKGLNPSSYPYWAKVNAWDEATLLF